MFEDENTDEIGKNQSPIENPLKTEDLSPPPEKILVEDEDNKGAANSLKFIFLGVIKLFYKPKEALENIRKKEGIGWPLLVLFGLYLIYALLGGLLIYFVTQSSFFTVPFVSSSTPSLLIKNSTFIFVAVLVLYLSMVMFYSVAFWTNAFLWGNFFNHLYGGKGKWYQYAVAILYLQISLVIVTLPLFILSILIGKLFSSFNTFYIVFLIGQLVLLIWWVIWQILTAKIYYTLSLIKAILAVLTPIIIVAVIFTSLFFYLKGYYSRTPLISFKENNGSDLQELNINTNFNGNLNFNINLTMVPFYQLSSEFRSENTKALLKELQEVSLGDNFNDRERQTDLINLKYNLQAYYQLYQQYPITSGKEKLSGSDVLNAALSDFFGYKFMVKDPEASQYYYSYESDGQSYTLTSYLVSKSEVFTITDKD